MDYSTDNLTKKIVGILVAIIVVAVVLIPITDDLTTDHIYNNPTGTYRYAIGYMDDVDLSVNFTANSSFVEINGNNYNINPSTSMMIISDEFSIYINYSANSNAISVYDASGNHQVLRASDNLAITTNNGVVNLTISGSTSYTNVYNPTWITVPDTNGNYVVREGSNVVYSTGIKSFMGGGYYSTGDNDCYYTLKNGVVTTSVDYGEHSAYITATPVEGSSNVVTSNGPTIVIGEESFTPYFFLCPIDNKSINEENAVSYMMLKVIPLFVLLGVILAVTKTLITGSKKNNA